MVAGEAVAAASQAVVVSSLVLAAVGKLTSPGALARTSRALGFHDSTSSALSIIVPACEGAVAVALTWPVTREVGATAATVLFAIFTTISVYAIAARRYVTCNCFGAGTHTLGVLTALRAGTLDVVSAILLWPTSQ